MASPLTFLALSRRCEVTELEHLTGTCELLDLIGRLVHGLQRERGLSVLYLGASGARFASRRLEQITACEPLAVELQRWFASIDSRRALPGARARLYGRIASAQQGLEALAALRRQVSLLAWPASRAAAAYRRLIAALLMVVYEAADDATDPGVSRLLVAVIHLMQAKEFAGQERAIGATWLATGVRQDDERQRLLGLIERQERCHRIVATFSAAADSGRAIDARLTTTGEQERLRRILLTRAGDRPLPADQVTNWFAACTQRIDAMRDAEQALVDDLSALCAHRLATARLDVERYDALVAAEAVPDTGGAATAAACPAQPSGDDASEALQFFTAAASGGLPARDPLWADGDDRAEPPGPGLGRSVLDLVCEQSRRLQAMEDELATVRATLDERKRIERAKGLLMAHRGLNEDQAHRVLRDLAMNQGRRLVDIAEAVLATADVLSTAPLQRH